MSTIFANIKYLLAPVLILVTFAGVLAGGIFAWLGVALLFVGIVIDTLIKKQASSQTRPMLAPAAHPYQMLKNPQ